MQRKISDVVLDLEARMRTLMGLAQNLDNNVKLILNHLNKQPKMVVDVPPDNVPSRSQEQIFVARPMVRDSLSDQSVPPDGGWKEEPELEEELVHKGQRRGLRKPNEPSSSNKVLVSQQILFPDGKSVFLANVEVFNSEGFIVKQTRTNANGKWYAAVDPGDYSVHVLKKMSPDNSKLPVELRYKITIPKSNEPLELPAPELSDAYR